MTGPCLCGDTECIWCGTAQGTYGREERWWRIRRPNTTPMYGFGLQEEAEEYARQLSQDLDLDVNHYRAEWMEEQPEELHEGFDLIDALTGDES